MSSTLRPSDIQTLAEVSESCARIEREACIRDVCAYCAADAPLLDGDMHARNERNGKPGPRRVKCLAARIHARVRAEGGE